MTRAEFVALCRSRQKAVRPKDIALVNCSEQPAVQRDPGDESEFAAVGSFADRLQKSLDVRRASSPQQTQGKV